MVAGGAARRGEAREVEDEAVVGDAVGLTLDVGLRVGDRPLPDQHAVRQHPERRGRATDHHRQRGGAAVVPQGDVGAAAPKLCAKPVSGRRISGARNAKRSGDPLLEPDAWRPVQNPAGA